MYKIIGADQQEYGPVGADDLRKWIAERRVDGKTLAQKEGETDWKPLSSFPEFADVTGGVVSSSSPPKLEDVRDAATLSAMVLSRNISVNVGSCVGRSWKLVKSDFWLIVGANFLVILAMMVISSVPFLREILSMILNGVLYGGLYLFFLKLIRGEEQGIGDAFAGFTVSPVQLMLAGVITGLLTGFIVILVGLPFFLPFFVNLMKIFSGVKSGSSPDMGSLLDILGVGGIFSMGFGVLIMMIVGIFLTIIWMFTFPLVIDKQLNFWEAMELSRKVAMKAWLKLFILMIVGGLITLLGVLACCVGVFVAVPVWLGTIAYAYEDIFGVQISKTT